MPGLARSSKTKDGRTRFAMYADDELARLGTNDVGESSERTLSVAPAAQATEALGALSDCLNFAGS